MGAAFEGVDRLFAYTSDYYVAMQGALEAGVQSLLSSIRDEFAHSNDAVCRAGVTPADVVAKFDPTGAMPEGGLLDLTCAAEQHDWHAGVAADRQLAAKYLGAIEGPVGDEMRLQSGNMIGHMAGSLAPWAAPMGCLQQFLHCNVAVLQIDPP